MEQFEEHQAQREDDRVILILDVSRAFLHPEMKRTDHCEFPHEDKTEGEDQVSELLKTMYGTRISSAEWEGYHSEVFEGAGAKTGLFSLLSLLSGAEQVESMRAR